MRNNIVIFEGHDRAGKTTISNRIRELSGYQLFKNGTQLDRFLRKDFTDAVVIEANYVLQMLTQCKFENGIIFDRSMPSEYVYSRVFGRKCYLPVIVDFDYKMSELNAKIVYCHKSLDVLKSTFSDEVIDFDMLQKIQDAYEDYFSLTRCRYLKLDTTDQNLDAQCNKILDFMHDGKLA